jgi:hypothetical protein
MKVRELIERLKNLDQEKEIRRYIEPEDDVFGGSTRDIDDIHEDPSGYVIK